MKVEWLLTARASARRFMADQAGMRAIRAAALPGARVARSYLLQLPGAFTQIACAVIRSHLRDAIRFWTGKELPWQPRL